MRATVRLSLVAVALACGAANALAADDIGTLFTTPEERARLDRLRRGEPAQPQSAAQLAAPGSTARKPALTGYVQRSDGRNTVWIDGRPVVVAAPDKRITLEPGMVQPQASDRVLHIDETGKEVR